MSRRAFLVLAFLSVFGLVLALWARIELDWANARVQGTALAGTFIALGWVATFFFREFSASIERRLRSSDIQRALLAEIADYAETLELSDAEGMKDDLAREIAANPAFRPYFFRVSAPVIFEANDEAVPLLPEEVIDDVIAFYSTLSDLRSMIEDLRDPAFGLLDGARRLRSYRDYVDLMANTARLARDAAVRLDDSLADRVTAYTRPDATNGFGGVR
ncbi:hypothetical protein [Jannaschia marina]|uniref:hypothetical protein n=1 Tax=Jannaschia marina TaxID=2741674 RepID=UPI0015CAB1DC|nr:hypothetical protein [Jannaschia marina]